GGNPSFRELARREREVALGAYMHQEAPFEKLVEEINPDRDLSRSPLFQVMMVLQNTLPRTIELEAGGLNGGGAAEAAKLDLTVSLTDAGRGLVGAVNYSRDLFEE